MSIKRRDDNGGREFWAHAKKTRLNIEKTWPEWKRNLCVTEYSVTVERKLESHSCNLKLSKKKL